MLERIVEIIVYVISEMKDSNSIADIDIEELHSRGYTDLEITVALSWLSEKFIQEKSDIRPQNEKSFRILHSAEIDLFTTESWGELMQYHSLGLIDNDTIEKIIEKALLFRRRKIDSNQLKSIIANILFYGNNNVSYFKLLISKNNEVIN